VEYQTVVFGTIISYIDAGYFIDTSNASVEFAFSTAGECTSTKKNRLTNQNLDTELHINRNHKHYFVL